MGYVTEPLEGGWSGGDGWHHGQTSRFLPVLCCPSCGSPSVLSAGTREGGAELHYWKCGSCQNRWKSVDDRLSSDVRSGRAILVKPDRV